MDCCKICGNSTDNKYHIVPEMIYGMGEEFKYMECSQCGCLQLPSPPDDLSKYYGNNYYSMGRPRKRPIRNWLDRKRYRYAIVDIPIIGYAWRKYGVNWVALDAPRHLYLHTVSSLKILAQKAGFQVTDIVYTSHAYQFWGNEQIARGIPIRSARSHADNPKQSIFSKEDMRSFHQQAQELNRQKDGDSASFY